MVAQTKLLQLAGLRTGDRSMFQFSLAMRMIA
jgi:hypothetical protein